jgi:arylsulfatase A-like enzyme
MPDGVVDQDAVFADWAIDFMENSAGPWFLAVGFFQPHVPWMGEEQDYALYQSVIPYAYTNDLNDEPSGAKELVDFPLFDGARQYDLVENAGAAVTKTRDYLAAISHTDRMVGRVLDAAPEGTLVILWADNGYHLGEKRHWRKWTFWQQTVRVPLIIKGIGQGEVSNPVSLLDIAPTVLDMAGVPPFSQFEGTSLRTGASPVEIYYENGKATIEGDIKKIVYDINDPTKGRSRYNLENDPDELENLANIPGCF